MVLPPLEIGIAGYRISRGTGFAFTKRFSLEWRDSYDSPLVATEAAMPSSKLLLPTLSGDHLYGGLGPTTWTSGLCRVLLCGAICMTMTAMAITSTCSIY